MQFFKASPSKDDAVELRVQGEMRVNEGMQKSVKLFEPRPFTCRRLIAWYFVCCFPSSEVNKESRSACCDTDHISAHIFLLILMGAIAIFIAGLIEGIKNFNPNKPNVTFIMQYLIGMVFGILLFIWGFVQMLKLFKGRLSAAQILDANNTLRRERAKLDTNIERTVNVQTKLEISKKTTKKATNKLREIFDNLSKFTQQIDIIAATNTNIGALLNNKYLILINRLRDQLIASEKFVIETIYNNMHLKDGEIGLDQLEFKEFVNKLPANYKERFKFELGSFDQYAGIDAIFDRRELFQILDKFVDDEIAKPSS